MPTLDRAVYAPAELLRRGAYVLNPSDGDEGPDVVLIASGSEVALIVAAEPILREANVRARLVSMPSWRLFEEQTAEYRESVLPSSVTARLAIEAASPLGWERWTGLRGAVIGIDRFGASAPGATLFKEYGFTVEHVVEESLALVGRRSERGHHDGRAEEFSAAFVALSGSIEKGATARSRPRSIGRPCDARRSADGHRRGRRHAHEVQPVDSKVHRSASVGIAARPIARGLT